MYAIRSYYACRIRLDPHRVPLFGQETVLINVPGKGSGPERRGNGRRHRRRLGIRLSCRRSRITSYNVCYTKLLRRLARETGADEVILYTEKDFESEVKRLTGGAGIQVVYDSVGQATFDKSLNCLAPRGYLVLYGQASGLV